MVHGARPVSAGAVDRQHHDDQHDQGEHVDMMLMMPSVSRFIRELTSLMTRTMILPAPGIKEVEGAPGCG